MFQEKFCVQSFKVRIQICFSSSERKQSSKTHYHFCFYSLINFTPKANAFSVVLFFLMNNVYLNHIWIFLELVFFMSVFLHATFFYWYWDFIISLNKWECWSKCEVAGYIMVKDNALIIYENMLMWHFRFRSCHALEV